MPFLKYIIVCIVVVSTHFYFGCKPPTDEGIEGPLQSSAGLDGSPQAPESTQGTPAVVTIDSPNATFEPNQPISFTAVVSGIQGIARFEWTIDGVKIPDPAQTINQTFSAAGSHTIQVNLFDIKNRLLGSATRIIDVAAPAAPEPPPPSAPEPPPPSASEPTTPPAPPPPTTPPPELASIDVTMKWTGLASCGAHILQVFAFNRQGDKLTAFAEVFRKTDITNLNTLNSLEPTFTLRSDDCFNATCTLTARIKGLLTSDSCFRLSQVNLVKSFTDGTQKAINNVPFIEDPGSPTIPDYEFKANP